MYIALLNHDILACILAYVYEPHIHSTTDIDDTRMIAQLATVSRRWFAAMCPRAFRVLVVQRTFPHGIFNHACHMRHRFLWICSGGYPGIPVRSLHLIMPDECRCPGLLLEALRNLAPRLSGVVKLTVLGRGHLTMGTLNGMDKGAEDARCLARRLGSVREFEFVVDYYAEVGDPQAAYAFKVSGFVDALRSLLAGKREDEIVEDPSECDS
ncbi:hypothetical protein EC988_007596, partial [Linderina pennispora]